MGDVSVQLDGNCPADADRRDRWCSYDPPKKKDHNKAYAIIIIYDFFFMPSIHPHSTSIILSRQVKRVPRVGYWSLAKRPPPGGAWKGKKEKKKQLFCDIILISWVTSARVAFISFHMQILNITLRLVPENMECKNMDRDSVCFLICFFPLRIEEGRRRAHAASVCKRYYSWLNSTHNIRELNIYFLYMAKNLFFFSASFFFVISWILGELFMTLLSAPLGLFFSFYLI